jgi:hypothetical protein
MKTAMQKLRDDISNSIEPSIKSLEIIQNEYVRETCIQVFKMTVDNILNGIDDDFLEVEKNRLVDAIRNENIRCTKLANGALRALYSAQALSITGNRSDAELFRYHDEIGEITYQELYGDNK